MDMGAANLPQRAEIDVGSTYLPTALGQSVKLLAFDLDGTLLNQRGHLSGANFQALQDARRQGLEITIVTGRHISKVRPLAQALNLTVPYVTSNGCEIWSPGGELLHRSSLPPAERQWLHRWAAEHDLGYRAYCVEGVFDWTPGSGPAALPSEARDGWGHSAYEWLKVLLEDARTQPAPWPPARAAAIPAAAARTAAQGTGLEPRCLSGLYARLEADPRFALAAYGSDPPRIRRIDVHPAGVDKAAGLEAVCRHVGVTAAQVAAFGDDTNDIAMLRWAGLGVAMEQAPAAVLDAANEVAPHHNRDGVATFVRRLLAP